MKQVNEEKNSSGVTTESPRPALLPCPFCGKGSSGQEFGPGPYLSRSQSSLFKSVICAGCCSIASGETESRVIERWNTRADARISTPAEDDHVGWCAYTYDDEGSIETLATCSSDYAGAFKVYRR